MLSAIVSLLEFSILFFATGRALVSIVNPKIQHAFYSLLFVLPISIILPVFVARAEAQAIDDEDHWDPFNPFTKLQLPEAGLHLQSIIFIYKLTISGIALGSVNFYIGFVIQYQIWT